MTSGSSETVKFEEALSDRSTCRATGERIAKEEWRVGIEVWLAGRMSWTWQKPLPFLHGCYVEHCANKGNCGTCRKTGHKFQRGEARFVCTSGDKKVYLSLESAGKELLRVLRHVKPRTFQALQFKGTEELTEGEREEFCKAFQVSKSEAARFNKEHPPPPAASSGGREEDAAGKQPPAKRARTGGVRDPACTGLRGGSNSRRDVKEEVEREDGEDLDAGTVDGTGEDESGAEVAAEVRQQGESMTEYERQRAEQIARNRERMMALQLPSLAAELAPSKPAPKPVSVKLKGISSRSQRLSEVLPRRSSLRVQGMAPDGRQVLSERRGEIIVVSGEAIRYNSAAAKQEEDEARPRHLTETLPFKSVSGNPSSDAAFVALLARTAAASPAGPAAGAATGRGRASKAGEKQQGVKMGRLGELRLAEQDIAKVTKGGITHLAFHPTASTLLLACADKYGHLGLWHVDHDTQATGRKDPGTMTEGGMPAAADGAVMLEEGSHSEGEAPASTPSSQGEGEVFDGVLQLQPHLQYVSGLRWAGGRLYTGSYDGSVRALDIEGAGASRMAYGDKDSEFSAMDVAADESTAVLGDNQGGLHVVDLRAGKLAHPALTVHNRKINTVHWEPSSEQVFATASTDSYIHLWDARTLGPKMKPLASSHHNQACQSAYFAPDGSRRVASTSFDDTVRVWDAKAGLAPLSTTRHDNQTGRWVFPFRAVWGPASDCLLVGNMKRYVDVLDASAGKLACQLSSEGMTAIAARSCAHPTLPAIAASTASGRVHIYR